MSVVTAPRARQRPLPSKVPTVTVWFWPIVVLGTEVGVRAGVHLDRDLGIGRSFTTALLSGLLVVVLALQLAVRRYLAAVYFPAVVVTGVVGTFVTGLLVRGVGLPPAVVVVLLGALFAATLWSWRRSERTLALHPIVARPREERYWATVLVACALGAAIGDLLTDELGLDHRVTGAVLAVLVAVVVLARWGLRLAGVAAFWSALVLTRPLGGVLDDLVARPRAAGGLGLGTTDTWVAFAATAVGLVVLVACLGVSDRGRPPAAG